MADDNPLQRDFFISRADADKDIALTIAKVLRDAGLSTWLQDEDFGHASFMERMEQGWPGSMGLLCLLSRAYQASEYCRKEYQVALAGDPLNRKERVIVLRVDDCAPAAQLTDLAYTDLLPLLNDAEALAQVVRGAVAPDRSRAEADLAALHRRLPQQVLHRGVHAVPGFVGRTEELAALEKGLWGEGGGTVTLVARQGMGGMGKSVLAREYAWRNRARYQGSWWVRSEQSATLLDDLIELGARHIAGLGQVKEREQAKRLALDWIESSKFEKPWLLVYDNVPEPRAIEGLTPRTGAHVLVTTRWADWGEAAALVPVGVFSPDVAVAYLLETTNRSDRAGAESLAAALGHLPLALSHAATYCRRTGMDFAAYKKLAGELLQKARRGVEYDNPVFATFTLAIERAAKSCPASEKLLGLAAYLAPDRIPLSLFTDDVLTEIERTEALAALSDVSLIALDPLDDTSPGIAVHRLVQAAMRERLKEMGEHDNAAVLATELVADAYPSGDIGLGLDDVRGSPGCASVNPHALAVLAHAPDSDSASRLLNQAALIKDFVTLGAEMRGDGAVGAPCEPEPATSQAAPAPAAATLPPEAAMVSAPPGLTPAPAPAPAPRRAVKATFLNWMFGRM